MSQECSVCAIRLLIEEERLLAATTASTVFAFAKISPPFVRAQSATASREAKLDAYRKGCFFPKTSSTGPLWLHQKTSRLRLPNSFTGTSIEKRFFSRLASGATRRSNCWIRLAGSDAFSCELRSVRLLNETSSASGPAGSIFISPLETSKNSSTDSGEIFTGLQRKLPEILETEMRAATIGIVENAESFGLKGVANSSATLMPESS